MPVRRVAGLALLVFASPVLFAAVSPALAQEPVELRWKFDAGEAFVTEWKQTLESRVTIEDGQGQILRRIETKYDLSMRIAWSIESVAEDGSAVALQKIEALTLAVRAPGNVLRQIELPGEQEPPQEFAALSAALGQAIGAPIRLTLSPRGEPTAAELPEAWQELAENEELGPSAELLSTAEGWKRLLASSTTPLPENPVAVGDKWTTDDPPLGQLPYRMKTEWTLAGVEGDVASLTFRSSVERVAEEEPPAGGAGEGTGPPAQTPPAAGVAVTAFERTGTATFDVADGTSLELRSETKLNLGKRAGEYVLATQQASGVTASTQEVDPQNPAGDPPIEP